ncbi:MAG: alpha/beta hydrolase [Prevotella sp.]
MIKKLLLFTLITCLCGCATAADRKKPFYMSLSDDVTAKMLVCLPDPDKNTGRAIVVCPGGGYEWLAMDNEGTNWIPFFNDRGIACIVLTYRMPHGDLTIPVGDAEKAMRTVRSNAANWGINPNDVGIMGSSAGGHLASTLATHSPIDARPDFQILFYPVISMDEKLTHVGSVHNFLGDRRNDPEWVEAYSNERQVRRGKTPPALILLTGDDTLVVPETNGMVYYKALKEAKVKADMIVYDKGGHGFGSQTNFKYHDQLLKDMSSWLKNLKAKNKRAKRRERK